MRWLNQYNRKILNINPKRHKLENESIPPPLPVNRKIFPLHLRLI
jgi:hypothetical protein